MLWSRGEFDAKCDELLDLMRKHPERAATLGRAVAAAGLSANEAAEAFGRMARAAGVDSAQLAGAAVDTG